MSELEWHVLEDGADPWARPRRRGEPRHEDEMLPTGVVVLWSQPRPGSKRVMVQYPCGHTVSRTLAAVAHLRRGVTAMCRACAIARGLLDPRTGAVFKPNCPTCGKPKAPGCGYCREHARLYTRRQYRLRTRAQRAGGTPEELAALVAEADGHCMICGQTAELVLDHDHATQRLRGMLCDDCNVGLGRFKDDPTLLRRAIAYLISESLT